METISLQLTKEQVDLCDQLYCDSETENKNPYILHQYRPLGCVITIYTSYKAVFQGKDAREYASVFMLENEDGFVNHAGSDEVGTGDFFGPICVCATIVLEKDKEILKELNVRDSKQLDDTTICKIAPKIMERIPYSLLILENSRYNEINPFNNMNMIKAKMHNQAYLNLQKKYALPSLSVIDQFCEEKTYYKYLKNTDTVYRNIYFTPKAEDKYLAVACGSIISRYAFLKKTEEMNKKYRFSFPKGAGAPVDKALEKFICQFGEEELKNVAKLNFKNYKKLLDGQI